MRFSVEYEDNIVILTLKTPNLDSEISAQMKAEILILCQPDITALIFNLTHVEYVDSSGLGALLLAYRQLKDNSIPVIIVGAQKLVRQMLNISQLEDLFEFYDTIEEAVTDLKE